MISSDRTTFEKDSNARHRMEAYAEAVGTLDIVIFTLARYRFSEVREGPLTLHPTRSIFRILYGLDVLRMRSLRGPFDVVTVQDPFEIGLVGLIISKLRRIPLHVQIHTDLFSPAFREHSFVNRSRLLMARLVLKNAARVRVVSDRIKNDVERRVPEATRKHVSVLPIYVDTAKFKQAKAPPELVSRFKNYKKKVLVVARLESEKNVALAIRSFAEGAPKDACLIIIGEGRQRAGLERLAKELGVSERTFFEGRRDPTPYYPFSDLLIVPSLYEGYGMVIIEALSASVPVLSDDVGIAPGAGAFIAEPSHFAREIRNLLAARPQATLLSYPYSSWESYVSAWRNDVAACLPITRRFAAFTEKKPLIGFIGQGFIGKNYADDFERRGYSTVRYSLEEPYRENKERVKECDITFIAVPTPTTPQGFDISILRSTLRGVGKGKVAVIKSTIVPGSTMRLQEEFPDIILLYSPEFLSEATASYDAAHPFSNIVGIPVESPKYLLAAEAILSVLPEAPFAQICSSTEAEIVKYSHNASAYAQIIMFNIMYDIARTERLAWDNIAAALKADPMISSRYSNPIHKTGRGAGGHCFIKDVAALREIYERIVPEDKAGSTFLRSLEGKNIDLLTTSNKDLDLLRGVYGDAPRVV
jgi:glycosyltransferase involved in cell wall biosynthesis